MAARGWGVVVSLVTIALGCSSSQRTCSLDGSGSECPAGNTCRGGICVASGTGCPRVCDDNAGADARDGGLVDASTGNELGTAVIEEFPIPTACSGPAFIAAGSDGNIWFTEAGTNQIGRVTPAGVIVEYPISMECDRGGPQGIAAGPDGNMWFTWHTAPSTDASNPRFIIGRITLEGTITLFQAPDMYSGAFGIAKGSDGNLWFTDTMSALIRQIAPSGRFIEFSLPPESGDSSAIIGGPDGNVWFTNFGSYLIGRMTPLGAVTKFGMRLGRNSAGGLAAGPDGNVWFTEEFSGQIGMLTPAGVLTEFSVPTSPTFHAESITAGSDGNLWFTEDAANRVARMTVTGAVTEFAVPTPASDPTAITAGPDGKIWFIEAAANKIARLSPE